MDFLADLRVLVLGLGDSGLAMARWCSSRGARVTVWDSREQPPQAAALGAAGTRIGGALADPALAAGFDLVVKSPGLAPSDATVAPLLAAASARGVEVLGELDLFARALADLKARDGWAPRLLAVTGTNGKTTTTAMTALLVERAGRRVAAGGNIGPSLLATLAQALERPADERPEVFVLELSSFQLEGGGTGVQGFEADAAVVLNLSQDHLDWHGSMAAYAAAKARVFGSRATMVINRDDPQVEAMVPPAQTATGKGRRARAGQRVVQRFGTDAPRRPGDWGLAVDGGIAWLVRAQRTDDLPRRGRGADDDVGVQVQLQHLMPVDALRLRGRHNAANALAALALATAIGCPLAPLLHGLREYRGEPHRVQPAGWVDGVEAFDDSKGTNVGATIAALDGLGADIAPGRLVVILGGDGKGQDFAPLAAPLQRHARAVALIGRDAARIERALAGSALPMARHATLPAATSWCFEQARPGDGVLLSPACASLDMFRNYAHRAEVFVAAVRECAAERGEVA